MFDTYNFSVFYHAVVKERTTLNQYDAVNILLLGKTSEAVGTDAIDNTLCSRYIYGKKPLPKHILKNLLTCSRDDIILRISHLGIQDITIGVKALKMLLQHFDMGIGPAERSRLLELLDGDDLMAAVADAFSVAIRCNPRDIRQLTDAEIKTASTGVIPKNYNIKRTIITDSENLSSPQNHLPEKTTLSPDGRSSDSIKSETVDSYNRFLGIYYGYYRSASSATTISGALMKIYKEDGQFKAIYITGLRDDKKMKNSDLKSIISTSSTPFEDYKNYTQTEEWKEQYSHFYEGDVEITDESILMHLKSPEKGTTKLTITTNLKAFKKDHEYMCGLALVLATSDGAFDTRIYRMGLINVKHGFMSLNTSGLPEQLLLSGSITQHLSVNADHRWCDFVRNHPCK